MPSPRQRHVLIGQEAAEAALASAFASGRAHHAWLIGGAEGIGKATLAFRAARYLLAGPSERTGQGLAVDPASRAARQVAAGSHPNLLVVERPPAGEKGAPKTIPIETVRRALSFFGTTAADGGHRICIVDALDDLNLNGANALLKTLEEPPDRATILLVSHAPGRVLATIRSRCRRLALAPLSIPDVDRVLATLGFGDDESVRRRAAAAAEGSVRRALTLLDPRRLAIVEETGALLALLPSPPLGRVVALAERLADRKAEADFAIVLDTVATWASERLRALAATGPRRLAPLAEVCEKAAEGSRIVEAYNLDRRPFVLAMFDDLASAIRQAV